jgi:DNA-dependent RNA polymerase auxiliary subunit epsilon
VIKNIYQHETIQIPVDITFGLLVDENQKAEFQKYFKNEFNIEYITRFDINYIINKKKLPRGYRLTRDYYLLKRKLD